MLSMFDLGALREFLARLSYREYVFEIRESFLQIRLRAPDRDTREQTWIQHVFAVPPYLDEDTVQHFVWYCVLEVERHEAGEFFRVDGKLPYDPHKEAP